MERRIMTLKLRNLRIVVASAPVLAVLLCSGDEKPSVQVASMDSVGPRPVEEQTRSGVVRDYLQAWQTMNSAFSENRPELLDAYFLGAAKERLGETIREQRNLGIETLYRDRSHKLQASFYSPEGLSIQLLDDVEYEMEV